jgi:S1-C subfamily serine protease
VSDPTPLEALSASIADAAAAIAPSIVEVASARSLSSGFVWRDGLIVTADEPLSEDGKIAIEFSDGSQHPVEIVGRDPSTDLVLLKVQGASTKSAALTTELPTVGALTVVVAAADSAPLVAFGGISSVGGAWRSMRGGQIDARIDLDLRLRHRAEGGLALDAAGRPYGMAVRGPRGRTLVIPTATIERVIPLILEHGGVPRGYLGLGLSDVSLTGGGSGAMVMAVDADGPGAAAGILQGDIVRLWNGEPVARVNRLIRTLDHSAIGATIALTVIRAGADMEISLTVAARPKG